MRLIDADALLKRMQEDPLFDLVERYGVSGVINAEPTVDLVFCHECQSHRNRVNMCDEWHRHTGPNGHCYKGRRYGQQTEGKEKSGRSEG